MAERKAVTKQMARRYAKASKTEKGLMLDELCALTEWTRRHARRALRQALSGAPEAPRKPRGRIYGQDVIQALRVVWATMNGAGRQAPGPVHGRDRRGPGAPRGATHGTGGPDQAPGHVLSDHRSGARPRTTAPAGEGPFRDQARIDPEASDPHPDLRRVGRGTPGVLRGRPRGPRRWIALRGVLPDPRSHLRATGWTEPRALRNKAQRWVHEAIHEIAEELPFLLLGLDSDNGSEFINVQLFT